MAKFIEFKVEGTAHGGQTYTCEGRVNANIADVPDCFMDVMRASFHQLTSGKAVFGQPGIGCRGPYTVTRIELKPGEENG